MKTTAEEQSDPSVEAPHRSRFRPLGRLAAVLRHNPGARALVLTAAGSALILVIVLALQVVDPRQIAGASVWAKPAKFAASVATVAASLAFVLVQLASSGVPASADRGPRRAGRLISAMACLELLLIGFQAARGVPSHFNATSAFDAAIFTTMGIGISLVWLAEAYLAWRAFRHPFSSRVLAWGVRLGLVATLMGGAVGFVMPRPTPTQRAALAAGHPPAALGAHAVGVPDGGPGLPITRWSTTGGDLRVPHFIGLHGLQILPVLGWALSRRRRGSPRAMPLIVFAGSTYLGLVITTLVQALAAQPLFAPDALTLVLAASSLLLAAGAAALVRPARPHVGSMPHRFSGIA